MTDRYLVWKRFGLNGEVEYLHFSKNTSWYETDKVSATPMTFRQAASLVRNNNKEAAGSMTVYGYELKSEIVWPVEVQSDADYETELTSED